MPRRELLPVVLAVVAAGGTLWWVNSRPDANPLDAGTAPDPATSAPATGTAQPPRGGPATFAPRPVLPPAPQAKLDAHLAALQPDQPGGTRHKAARELAKLGPLAADATDRIVALLAKERDPALRLRLIETLGHLQSGVASAILLSIASGTEPVATRAAAVEAIRRVGAPESPVLLERLRAETDATVLAGWVALTARRREPEITTRLVELVGVGSQSVRAAAARALAGRFRRPSGPAYSSLLTALAQGATPELRTSAALALSASVPDEAKAPIRAAIAAEPDPEARTVLQQLLDVKR